MLQCFRLHSHLCWHRVLLGWGATWFLSFSCFFGLRLSTRMAGTPSTALSVCVCVRVCVSAPCWIRSLGKSQYTGGNWKAGTCYGQDKGLIFRPGLHRGHPPFCLSLSPARLLHSYVGPSYGMSFIRWSLFCSRQVTLVTLVGGLLLSSVQCCLVWKPCCELSPEQCQVFTDFCYRWRPTA